jgi:hypothetical protein
MIQIQNNLSWPYPLREVVLYICAKLELETKRQTKML